MTSIYAIGHSQWRIPPQGRSRAMEDIIMFNPVVTIITPIPKWLHTPHRFEWFCIFSWMLSEEVTRTQKECIRSFVGSIDPAVHCRGATICKHVVSGMSLFVVVSLAIMRDVYLGRCRVIWTSLNRWWGSGATVGFLLWRRLVWFIYSGGLSFLGSFRLYSKLHNQADVRPVRRGARGDRTVCAFL